ncbi:VOC family protein [Rhodoblastus acidophilus]|uniref:VOC family protein n=1 Tax=Candidatus Rhodoblastus alkanivorans TaxID=2954117 RepID=A0ABS9Z2D1_9HYPH|nr:VOC family protein [Candidatus Rhodoblastus alkanivorans]MCI4678059.1 VOC family protein [Candidatus Rhodoblastus alkanivorans]MCI4681600.1 VOC family protein [Candidatus Rhodoblastus alkanivorans]MDI4642648.1 VOC family protein [Rhodoblastus acidophilus]
MTRKITLCLWFNGCAEEATALYAGLFPESRVIDVSRYGDGEHGAPGAARIVTMELFGQKITAINGGGEFALTPAMSLLISCETQAEVDRYWDGLAAGGKPMRCGWITDRFGVTWQIIPAQFKRLISDPNTGGRVMAAACEMTKVDIAALERAAQG